MGLRIVGITAIVFAVLFSLYWTGRMLLTSDNKEDEPTEITLDTDGDGMADAYETSFYHTDPKNVDTDGDGMSDRDEIVAGRDPLIPGPDDVSKPLTGSSIQKPETYTDLYLASLPKDVSREGILDQVQLEVFVNKNKGILLPEMVIKNNAIEGKEAISAYLDNISSTHNDQIKEITSSDIELGFQLIVRDGEHEPLREIVTALKNNMTTLHDISAPTEASNLHTKLVSASSALHLNAERLLYLDQDFVGGLIAAKNIEELGGIFQEMATEIDALELKYGLK